MLNSAWYLAVENDTTSAAIVTASHTLEHANSMLVDVAVRPNLCLLGSKIFSTVEQKPFVLFVSLPF
jgi:hypothetical protein